MIQKGGITYPIHMPVSKGMGSAELKLSTHIIQKRKIAPNSISDGLKLLETAH
jgi:hypothetical protein